MCEKTESRVSSTAMYEGSYGAWLTKVKGNAARAKWLSSTTRRFYTIDFNSQVFYYSHSEEQKSISQPIAFKDILSAELLPRSAATLARTRGFLLRTRSRDFELYPSTDSQTASWVLALNAARDRAQARSEEPTSEASYALAPSSSQASGELPEYLRGPSRESSLGAIGEVGGGEEAPLSPAAPSAQEEEECKHALYRFPSSVRIAAARKHPAWSSMSWRERFSAAQYLQHLMQSAEARRDSPPEAPQGPPSSARRQPAAFADIVSRESEGMRFRQPARHGMGAVHETRSAPGPPPGSRDNHTASIPAPGPPPGGHAVERSAIAHSRVTPAPEQTPHVVTATSRNMRGATAAGVSQHPVHDRRSCQSHTDVASIFGTLSPSHAGHGGGPSTAMGTVASAEFQLDFLKTTFELSDGLRVLVGHHLDGVVEGVIKHMKPCRLDCGEILLHQGQQSDRCFIVEEGSFDAYVTRGDGRRLRACQYGPGSVFGEHALVSRAPRAATVVATTPAKIWTLDRQSFELNLKAPDSTKTIGLLGGVMLLINNLAGPTIVSMPALAQEAGWLSVLLVQMIVAAFACVCGYMLIEAMRRMPGNHKLDQRIEFTNLANHYLPQWLYFVAMLCYHVNSVLTLMSLIIQSGQVIDYFLLNTLGCAPGLVLDWSGMGYVCASRRDSNTPFGDTYALSSSMAVVAIICAPFAVQNLDDNVILQYFAIVGLCVMAVIWLALLVAEPAFPSPLPVITASQSSLIGTVLFNFAFCSTLPSWVNEKKPSVSTALSFGITMGFVVVLYTVVGVVGGMAYPPFYTTDENLFSKLSAGGTWVGQATVTAYPMLQNFTSIPVYSILMRYNLLQSGFAPVMATLIAVAVPWALSVPFYTGSGFDTIAELGGLVTSSVVNFVIPAVIYAIALQRGRG